MTLKLNEDSKNAFWGITFILTIVLIIIQFFVILNEKLEDNKSYSKPVSVTFSFEENGKTVKVTEDVVATKYREDSELFSVNRSTN